ncbi:hypothetical protein WAF17_06045 [Bernardetia sp. ABR2-2B]|uniref:hypothetical protein n=1 Tax=Bernardetia sp. ABR2-2B TaxID=3127472 RepID=UPI0030D39F8F
MKKIYLLLLVLLFIQGCGTKQPKVLVNEEIDSQLKDKIEKMNRGFLRAVTSNNIGVMKKMIDTDKYEGEESFEAFFEKMHEHIESDNYTILDEYHIKNTTMGGVDTLHSINKKINSYELRYPKKSTEMFVSLILVDSFGEKVLLTIMYGRVVTGWRIAVLHIGGYTTNNKTAPELYIKSKKEFEKGHLINSMNIIFLAIDRLEPAGMYIKYDSEQKIKTHYEMVLRDTKIAYTFPLSLQDIKTQPIIFDIYPEVVDSNYCPVFRYISKIDIQDTLQLKEENIQVHERVKKIFKGVDKGSKNIAYKVLNRFPQGEFDEVKGYGFYKKNE